MEKVEAEFNENFITRIIPKLDLTALNKTCVSLGLNLPTQESPEYLKIMHDIILETRIKDGIMICDNCHHEYVIKDGIPNMLLNENQV